MKIIFAPEALGDLEATVGYIRDRDWDAAARVAERVLEVIGRIAEQEFEGPETLLSTGDRVRSWPVPPLRIYYERAQGALHVLRIYHQSRRPITR